MHGGIDKTLKVVEESFDVEISIRGNKLIVRGKGSGVERAERLIEELRAVNMSGYTLKPEDISYALKSMMDGEDISVRELFSNNIPVASKKRFIIPKTRTQRLYINAIRSYDITFGVGPAPARPILPWQWPSALFCQNRFRG